jgi:hypothetical protein
MRQSHLQALEPHTGDLPVDLSLYDPLILLEKLREATTRECLIHRICTLMHCSVKEHTADFNLVLYVMQNYCRFLSNKRATQIVFWRNKSDIGKEDG